MTKFLKVSRSGYYKWLNKKPTKKEKEDEFLKVQAKKTFEESKNSYGVRRILEDFQEAGIECGKHRLKRLMKEMNIVPFAAKKFKVTKDSNHNKRVFENLLDKEFHADAPNQKRVGDFTYIWTNEGWLYLAIVIDLFSRKVVGWSMSTDMDARLVVSTFNMAVNSRKPQSGLIFHSDKGSQYCSNEPGPKTPSSQNFVSKSENLWSRSSEDLPNFHQKFVPEGA